MTRLIALFLLVLLHTFSFAGEGMWLPFLLKALNEGEMKSMGMKMSAEDIYSVNQGSLKDAVVHFGGFCTAEVISDQGLILTNHHCGYDVIQQRSTLEKNYLTDGYWAKRRDEELPNPGLFATFIVRIEDVTSKVTNGLKEGITPKERQSIIEANSAKMISSVEKEHWQDASIKPFFEGNDYYIFITETYNDVRYVGSPPESIGKFGADTDNWVWPRHTGDFSMFRIYAGPDNKPAEYSPDNKPLKPRYFFPVSLDGVD
ncbi:MAG: S46 family peptidase, partial [Bacteroidota bacterium]|nr:S46 family peptidase [Bacteroidota bacterium]